MSFDKIRTAMEKEKQYLSDFSEAKLDHDIAKRNGENLEPYKEAQTATSEKWMAARKELQDAYVSHFEEQGIDAKALFESVKYIV